MLRAEPKTSEEIKHNDDEEEEEEEDEEEEVSSSEDEDEKKKEELKWDTFKDTPYESESISMADTSIINALIQILKLLAYITTFLIVLVSAVSSKAILLLMTSQLTPDRSVTVQMGSMILGVKIPIEEKYLWIWALLICFSVPEIGAFIRSFRIAVFKGYVNEDESLEPENTTENTVSLKCIFLVTFLMETFHTMGLAIFIFEILPHMDVAKGVMLTNCVCLVPGLLGAISNTKGFKSRLPKIFGDIFAVLFQISGLIAWPVLSGTSNLRLWVIPFSLSFISCGWWMNYVSKESRIGFIKFLAKIKDKLKEKKVILYKIYMCISIWKIVVFFTTTLLVLVCQGYNIVDFFDKTGLAFSDRKILAEGVELIKRTYTNKTYPIPSVGLDIWWIIGAQVFSAYICYIFSKFACRVMIQPFSFAFPCALVVPVTLVLIAVTTSYRNQNPAVFSDFLPSYVFFNFSHIYDAWEFFINQHSWIWVFWIMSQIWITFHIWMPICERLSKTEKLFATPMYSAFLVDQSVALNRRRDEVEVREKKLPKPHIIACVTMWHETRPEMLETLKSLLRMDNDQCLKSSARNNVKGPEAEANFYTFEAHIFFDDAFELEDKESTKIVLNKYVKDFLKVYYKAAMRIYGVDSEWLKPPLKYSTPYGGRLEYTMPGENKLYVHLKDKDKIRHKKRWSQVMYMYYLLGFNLMELPAAKKMEEAENTYLLALDGDIDFKPDAVLLLVDLMKKNKSLGAACGRIHPVGSGFMVWYQQFEYAIGHWLQKATEHMIGCVLCSPGCFSLFRAKALMDQNVMKRYTTIAEEPRQVVQYDQGEDRWLCTLLLQRGHRVEYSAASDAYTHCPETFNEFYTQRRRWIPSTMANIVDLLNDYKRTVTVNNDISLPYIGYQMLLLVGTILGPGTILLMLVGAFNTAFKIDNYTAFYYNLIPIVAFMLCCLFSSGKFQLSAALLISLVYGLIMMAVLVGIVMEIKDDGPLSPSSLFLFITAGEIIVAGLLHPQEMFCLLSGVIYYVTIPSMYLLLIIYSVCNLNEVSWGTREGVKKKTKEDLENEKREAELAEKKAQRTKLFGILDNFTNTQEKEKSGALEFSLSNIFKCMCCTNEKPNQIAEQYVKIGETLNVLKKKMDDIEKVLEGDEVEPRRRSTFRRPSEHGSDAPQSQNNKISDNVLVRDDAEIDELRDDLFNPYWIEDKDLQRFKFGVLSSQEITFWKKLIKNYLAPIITNQDKKKEVKKSLKELRDKMVVTFFMLNALFVVVVFLLQVNKDQIHIKWPLGARPNITFNKVTYEINIQKHYLQLEPVGLTFISFFASILVIQFVAMLFHRFETLCHLLSNTSLTILQKKKAMSFREKLEHAKKQLERQNQEQSIRRDENIADNSQEVSINFQENPSEKRKAKDNNLEKMYNSIFKEINETEERETAEREERRKSSLLPWRRGSLNPRNLNAFTNLGLSKIDEDNER